MKPLTHKGILKRHKKNPEDKDLHKIIETKEVKRDTINRLIEEGVKQKAFDINKSFK